MTNWTVRFFLCNWRHRFTWAVFHRLSMFVHFKSISTAPQLSVVSHYYMIVPLWVVYISLTSSWWRGRTFIWATNDELNMLLRWFTEDTCKRSAVVSTSNSALSAYNHRLFWGWKFLLRIHDVNEFRKVI